MESDNRIINVLELMDINKWSEAIRIINSSYLSRVDKFKINSLNFLIERFKAGKMGFDEANKIVHYLIITKNTKAYEIYLWIKIIIKLTFPRSTKLEHKISTRNNMLHIDADNFCRFMFIQGKFFLTKNNWQEAVNNFNSIIALNKMTFEVAIFLAQGLYMLNKYEQATNYFIKAKEINPEHELIYSYEGILKFNEKKFVDARKNFAKIAKLNPLNRQNIENLALIDLEEYKLSSAISSYKKLIELEPKNYRYIEKLATIQLMLGNYKEGLKNYENRLMLLNNQAVNKLYQKHKKMFWKGNDIGNKKLLLVSEQGLGDIIFCFRYIPLLIKKNINISIVVPNSLHRLINISYPELKLINDLNKIECDVISSTMSLIKIFEKSPDTVQSNMPYFNISDELRLKWSRIINSLKPKIGLVWFGNKNFPFDADRSMKLGQLSELLKMSSFQWYSLQIDGSKELKRSRDNINIINLEEKLDDSSDTAAAIYQLDLVICVDTAVAHLAGSLGKPVWTLNRYLTDWRWGINQAQVGWYPSMKLFRQDIDRQWEPVIKQVKNELLDKFSLYI
ncbi:MAG: hypothetical protein HRT87_03145 [Legionellales bacterium]|nr:hypothetical protein [Legionellales bacterium]